MKKSLFIVIGIVALGVGYWLISPLFIEKKVNESLTEISNGSGEKKEPLSIFAGSFVGLAGHSGEGTATILETDGEYYLRFEDNFRVTNGPDLFIHFGKNNQYDSNARIASLKGNVGGQNYKIPQGISPRDFSEVWIWCRSFSVPFAKAVLK